MYRNACFIKGAAFYVLKKKSTHTLEGQNREEQMTTLTRYCKYNNFLKKSTATAVSTPLTHALALIRSS